MNFSFLQTICVWALPILTAITFHEAAHAYIANLCGDDTAKRAGRLSINPLRHFDFVGSFCVPVFLAFITQFHLIFGWAKPVPIGWNKLKHPRFDMLKVAAAGPIANFVMAFLFLGLFRIISMTEESGNMIRLFFLETSKAGILVNVFLGWLNLFPLPPLDGGRIVSACLPLKWAYKYSKIEPYGIFILIALIFSGVIQAWLMLPMRFLIGSL